MPQDAATSPMSAAEQAAQGAQQGAGTGRTASKAAARRAADNRAGVRAAVPRVAANRSAVCRGWRRARAPKLPTDPTLRQRLPRGGGGSGGGAGGGGGGVPSTPMQPAVGAETVAPTPGGGTHRSGRGGERCGRREPQRVGGMGGGGWRRGCTAPKEAEAARRSAIRCCRRTRTSVHRGPAVD